MHESFEWFLGANRLGIWLYDFSTGGCRDGLGIHEASQNEGAESTVSFLMALLTMLDVGGCARLKSEEPGQAAEAVRTTAPEDQKGSVEVVRRRRENASSPG